MLSPAPSPAVLIKTARCRGRLLSHQPGVSRLDGDDAHQGRCQGCPGRDLHTMAFMGLALELLVSCAPTSSTRPASAGATSGSNGARASSSPTSDTAARK